MLCGALAAPETFAAAELHTGIAALQNGSSKLEPPVAGLMPLAPLAAVKVKSPVRVAEAPALVIVKVERSPSVTSVTPNFPPSLFIISGFPPKESGAVRLDVRHSNVLSRAT